MAKQELTLKQRKFIKFYVETGNLAEACERAGYQAKDRENLTVIGCQNLAKLRSKIAGIMDEMGLDNVNLLKKLDEGLDSMVVKIASEKGIITDEKAYIDFPTRAKYLEMGFKLNGGFAPEKKAISGENGGPVELKVIFDKKKGNGADAE